MTCILLFHKSRVRMAGREEEEGGGTRKKKNKRTKARVMLNSLE